MYSDREKVILPLLLIDKVGGIVVVVVELVWYEIKSGIILNMLQS